MDRSTVVGLALLEMLALAEELRKFDRWDPRSVEQNLGHLFNTVSHCSSPLPFVLLMNRALK